MNEIRNAVIVMLVWVALVYAIVIHMPPQVDGEVTKETSAVEGVDFKIFALGEDPTEILTKTEADYEISGYPATQIMIRNWDKIPPDQQVSLTAELNAMGYFELRG